MTRRMRIAMLCAALMASVPAAAQQPPRPPSISVTGSGEAELKPDFARIFVTVGTQADTIAQAVDLNRAATERALARLEGIGIKRDDIATAGFQVFQTPQPQGPDGREQKVPRFSVDHRIRVKTRDVAGVGKLAGEVLAAGDVTFQSISFGLDRQDEGGDVARRAAVRDAKRQAEVFAEAAGVKLGRLIEIRDGAAHPLPESDMPMMRMRAVAAEAVPLVPPATLRFNASVQLVYEIAP
ncbi:SIMPL domain-containing protein [Microvirga massiliensis]|uniref:SIMPL domain-containing protein n=1 Tax=Microvirga massiliensis TaxID=1033741 RepID=UPI00062B5840|nr:SIMPL domain-containing protein [Microvirga massiliensis]